MTKALFCAPVAASGLSVLLLSGLPGSCGQPSVDSSGNGQGLKPLTVNDSPVVVRGGSAKLRQKVSAAWTKNTDNVYELGVGNGVPAEIHMRGVAKIPPASPIPPTSGPSPVDLTATYNWTITFHFRKDDGTENKNSAELDICTAGSPNAMTCPNPPQGRLPNPVYLIVVGGNGGSLGTELLDASASSNFPLSFETQCGGSDIGKYQKCNHIARISYVTADPSSPNAVDYYCFYGTCDIGIGPPN